MMIPTAPPPSAEEFSGLLAQEAASGSEALRGYYHSLAASGRAPFARYNWRRRTDPLRKLLLGLPQRERPWRVLDAGCGLGTESYYWSVLRSDVEVLGVDISPERLAQAEARRPFYEQLAGRALNLRFQNRDIFKVLEAESFDAIWTMEAISHIDPAERFLEAAARNLLQPDGESNPAGWLVISDSNRINPYMLWRISLLRQHTAAHSHRTLSSGETIGYAHERLFSVPELAGLLRSASFRQVHSQLSVFFPPALARAGRLYAALDAALNSIPLVRHLGGIYTVSARAGG